MSDDFASIHVEAFDAAVSELESTLDGLTNSIAPLRRDFERLGVDLSNLNRLRIVQNVLEDVVPDLRERHRLASQLLDERFTHPAYGGTEVVSFEGDLLYDHELEHRTDMSESIDLLKDAGLLSTEPGSRYREWISWTLKAGLSPQDVVDRARQENVAADTFDPLEDVTIWRDPNDRPYAHIEVAEDAKSIVRLIELLNGGEPSKTDIRRNANSWSYSRGGSVAVPLLDIHMVLDNGGALAATPEGILMAAPGPKTLGALPNVADAYAFKGGSAWGEIYVKNDSFDYPVGALQMAIAKNGFRNAKAPNLERLLRHERVHSEQWARLGPQGFIARYLRYGLRDPCHHPMEVEAGLEDAGYECD